MTTTMRTTTTITAATAAPDIDAMPKPPKIRRITALGLQAPRVPRVTPPRGIDLDPDELTSVLRAALEEEAAASGAPEPRVEGYDARPTPLPLEYRPPKRTKRGGQATAKWPPVGERAAGEEASPRSGAASVTSARRPLVGEARDWGVKVEPTSEEPLEAVVRAASESERRTKS